MRDYVNMDQCPFRPGDRVQCQHTKVQSTVTHVEEVAVFCIADDGQEFYRTWTHELDTFMHKSGGGLTRLNKR